VDRLGELLDETLEAVDLQRGAEDKQQVGCPLDVVRLKRANEIARRVVLRSEGEREREGSASGRRKMEAPVQTHLVIEDDTGPEDALAKCPLAASDALTDAVFAGRAVDAVALLVELDPLGRERIRGGANGAPERVDVAMELDILG
jgi:hypothetical protein